MKKLYTDPRAEMLSLLSSDIIANSGDPIIEADDITPDSFAGAGSGYETVF